MENQKAFVLLKTKQELLTAEAKSQLVLVETVKTELNNEKHKLGSLFGATVEKNSPGRVTEVKLVNSPEVFQELMF